MLNLSPIASLLGALASIVSAVIPILITLALAAFLWGLVRYLWGSGGKANIDGAKKLMRWGLIILFVMVSVWGIIELMQTGLGINKNAQGQAPQINYPGAQTYSSSGSTGQSMDEYYYGIKR